MGISMAGLLSGRVADRSAPAARRDITPRGGFARGGFARGGFCARRVLRAATLRGEPAVLWRGFERSGVARAAPSAGCEREGAWRAEDVWARASAAQA
jgi:hypothetical protein